MSNLWLLMNDGPSDAASIAVIGAMVGAAVAVLIWLGVSWLAERQYERSRKVRA